MTGPREHQLCWAGGREPRKVSEQGRFSRLPMDHFPLAPTVKFPPPWSHLTGGEEEGEKHGTAQRGQGRDGQKSRARKG